MTVSRKIWAGFAGVLLLGGGATAVWWPRRVIPEVVAPVEEPGLGWTEPAEAPTPGVSALPGPAAGPVLARPVEPSFDVVRVSPDGSAVVAAGPRRGGGGRSGR